MSQISYTNLVDGDTPTASGFNSRFLLAINLLNGGIEADNIASNAVTSAKINANAVTLAKMADGTQGGMLYYGASGVIAELAAGTSGQFLKTQGAGANPTWASVPSAVGGQWRNLSVTRPGTTQVTVTADELVVYDTSLNGVRITSVNETATITTSGANGLDTGSEAANTIYYVWIIRKSSDGTVDALLSTASTIGTITFPSGYDQAALVSAVGNNNSSDFIDFVQNGNLYEFTAWGAIASGTASAWTAVDLTPANMSTNPAFVPSGLSNVCFGNIGVSAGDDHACLSNINTTSTAVSAFSENRVMARTSHSSGAHWRFRVLTADTLYWGTGAQSSVVYLAGFEINKIG